MNRNDKSITLMRWQLPGTVSTNITRFTGPLSPSRAGIRAVTRNDTPVHTLEPKGYIGEFDNCRGTRVGRARVPAPRAANFERLMNLRRGERASRGPRRESIMRLNISWISRNVAAVYGHVAPICRDRANFNR